MARKKKKYNPNKGIRGNDRKTHFDSGGSLREWRGTHIVHRHKNSKRLGNRSQRKKKAIDESRD